MGRGPVRFQLTQQGPDQEIDQAGVGGMEQHVEDEKGGDVKTVEADRDVEGVIERKGQPGEGPARP
jgi:hypothetical protein